MLGAEIGSLPADVGASARVFFEKNIEWLTAALTAARIGDGKAKVYAVHILGSLEGAMIVSKTLGDDGVLESVARTLLKLVEQ